LQKRHQGMAKAKETALQKHAPALKEIESKRGSVLDGLKREEESKQALDQVRCLRIHFFEFQMPTFFLSIFVILQTAQLLDRTHAFLHSQPKLDQKSVDEKWSLPELKSQSLHATAQVLLQVVEEMQVRGKRKKKKIKEKKRWKVWGFETALLRWRANALAVLVCFCFLFFWQKNRRKADFCTSKLQSMRLEQQELLSLDLPDVAKDLERGKYFFASVSICCLLFWYLGETIMVWFFADFFLIFFDNYGCTTGIEKLNKELISVTESIACKAREADKLYMWLNGLKESGWLNDGGESCSKKKKNTSSLTDNSKIVFSFFSYFFIQKNMIWVREIFFCDETDSALLAPINILFQKVEGLRGWNEKKQN
jgi:hypothetical protein